MTALAAGERSAFGPVFSILWPLLRRFCERALNDADLAQDAAQTALMKLFLHAADFRSDRDAASWALGFASFECRTARNRVTRRSEQAGEAPLAAVRAGETTPEDALIDADLHRAALELLGSLPPLDAETLRLALGGARPAGSASFRKRLQRALGRFRTAWSNVHGSSH